MIILIFITAILLIVGIVILVGKGDNLMAGYNTASKKEREEYDVKRLRYLVGGLLIILAPMTFFLLGEETMTAGFSYVALTFILCIIVLILANTWAKNKSK